MVFLNALKQTRFSDYSNQKTYIKVRILEFMQDSKLDEMNKRKAVPSIRMPKIQVNRSRLIEFPSTIKARNEFRASLKLHKLKLEDEN